MDRCETEGGDWAKEVVSNGARAQGPVGWERGQPNGRATETDLRWTPRRTALLHSCWDSVFTKGCGSDVQLWAELSQKTFLG